MLRYSFTDEKLIIVFLILGTLKLPILHIHILQTFFKKTVTLMLLACDLCLSMLKCVFNIWGDRTGSKDKWTLVGKLDFFFLSYEAAKTFSMTWFSYLFVTRCRAVFTIAHGH